MAVASFAPQIAALGAGAFCTLVLPVLLLIVLGLMKKLRAAPLFMGFASFFVSQVVLRIPLLQVLSGMGWFQNLAAHTVVYALVIGGFTAGLFEETGRLAGGALLKKHRTYKDMISFGLGHGLCEVIVLIGMGYLNNMLICMALDDPAGPMAAVLTGLSAEALSVITAQLTALSPVTVALGVVERVSAVLYHIFATCLVFTGIKRRKPAWYLAAIVAHTLFNFISVLLAGSVGLWVTEAVLLVIGAGCGVYVYKARAWFDRPCAETPAAPAEG